VPFSYFFKRIFIAAKIGGQKPPKAMKTLMKKPLWRQKFLLSLLCLLGEMVLE